MNTMWNKNTNLIQQFSKFKKDLEASGKKPEALLDELVSSGKVNKEQIERAKKMASAFSWLLK